MPMWYGFRMPCVFWYLLEGLTCHLTHRRHDRRVLLKFALERDACREWLRKGVRHNGVCG